MAIQQAIHPINCSRFLTGEQVHVSYEDCDELLNESDSIELGKIYHKTKAEQYPQIRWNFKWKDYSLIGIPDGLTAEFSYEYKSTRNTYMMECTAKPVADAQAGLYAHFHRRPKTRVQLYLKEERRTVTSEEPLDQDYVQDTLELFERTTNGEHPKPPAEPWKCRSHNCEFNDECPVSHMVD